MRAAVVFTAGVNLDAFDGLLSLRLAATCVRCHIEYRVVLRPLSD